MPQKSETIAKMKVGCLVIPDRLDSSLPLEHTLVNIQVSGPLASALVSQRFGNPLAQVIDLEYLYPLPENAAITDFVLQVGEHTIRAELKEAGEAARRFEDARQGGQRAGLFEQRRPNLFAVRLANVQPGETIQASVRYQQRLAFSEDGYELVFPMGLTPKYDSPEHPAEGAGVHAPLAGRDEPIGPVEISVALDAGIPCDEPHSPSHAIGVVRLDERRFQLQLAGQEIPDHDFVLRYAPPGERPQATAWLAETDEGGYFLASLLPPRMGEEPLVGPREFIFVLDRSGSMGGEPIAQARNALRACLRTLSAADTFRILLFDDRLEWYREAAAEVNQAEIDRADGFLGGVNARGGTEIVVALQAALGLAADPQRTRLVVFLTDGAVSAELRTLELLRQQVGEARVFTFGIGPSVNRALLSRMAGLGRGTAEFLQADEDIEGAIIRFQDRVSFPALSDLRLDFIGGSAWDVYPARLADLYLGQPLEISGRAKRSGAGPLTVKLSGRRGKEMVTLQAEMSAVGAGEAAVARLWARARVDDLLDEAALAPQRQETIRSAVIDLALAHRLVTPYTAFVGVDPQVVTGGGRALSVQVAQPLPRGLDWDGSAPGVVHTTMDMRPPQVIRMNLPAAPMAARGKLARGLAEAPGLPPMQPAAASSRRPPAVEDRAALLRWLARTQQLDGSWDGNLERSAAALLAFVRAGQTTRQGAFRVTVRRAMDWLLAHEGQDWTRFLRARALDELAQASGVAAQREQAQAARAGLPAPGTELERAAAGLPLSRPDLGGPLASLEALRLAALAQVKPQGAVAQFDGDLERTWLACLII